MISWRGVKMYMLQWVSSRFYLSLFPIVSWWCSLSHLQTQLILMRQLLLELSHQDLLNLLQYCGFTLILVNFLKNPTILFEILKCIWHSQYSSNHKCFHGYVWDYGLSANRSVMAFHYHYSSNMVFMNSDKLAPWYM